MELRGTVYIISYTSFFLYLMRTSVIITVIVATAIAFGTGSYFAKQNKSISGPEAEEQAKAPVANRDVSEQTESHAQPTTLSVPVAAPAPATDEAKLITCHPTGFNPPPYSDGEPCTTEMTSLDSEREKKALAIIEGILKAEGDKYCLRGGSYFAEDVQFAALHISDARYPVVAVNCAPKWGYVVVDLVSEQVTDYFVFANSIEYTHQRIVFTSSEGTKVHVRLFEFGTEVSRKITDSELDFPQTYLHTQGPMSSATYGILVSDNTSITLGIYDSSKGKIGDGEDFVTYPQVGMRRLDL